MAVTQADRDALMAAIARGVKRVQQDGQVVEYQTIADMKIALDLMDRELAAVAGVARSSVSYVRVGRRPGSCWPW